MFMIAFALGLAGIVTGTIRFFACWLMESIKGDRFSDYRKREWRKVWIHYGVTFLFFYLAFHI